jgi:hypothetical protein
MIDRKTSRPPLFLQLTAPCQVRDGEAADDWHWERFTMTQPDPTGHYERLWQPTVSAAAQSRGHSAGGEGKADWVDGLLFPSVSPVTRTRPLSPRGAPRIGSRSPASPGPQVRSPAAVVVCSCARCICAWLGLYLSLTRIACAALTAQRGSRGGGGAGRSGPRRQQSRRRTVPCRHRPPSATGTSLTSGAPSQKQVATCSSLSGSRCGANWTVSSGMDELLFGFRDDLWRKICELEAEKMHPPQGFLVANIIGTGLPTEYHMIYPKAVTDLSEVGSPHCQCRLV